MTLTPEKADVLFNRIRHAQEVGPNLNTFVLLPGDHDDLAAALDIARDFLAGRLVRSLPTAPTPSGEQVATLRRKVEDLYLRPPTPRPPFSVFYEALSALCFAIAEHYRATPHPVPGQTREVGAVPTREDYEELMTAIRRALECSPLARHAYTTLDDAWSRACKVLENLDTAALSAPHAPRSIASTPPEKKP